jgi:hypothetical protein
LIYSPNAIKEIKRICKSKIAYMVPAKTNWDENYLAYEIGNHQYLRKFLGIMDLYQVFKMGSGFYGFFSGF